MNQKKSVLLQNPNPDGNDDDCTACLIAASGDIESPVTAPQIPPGTSGSYLHIPKSLLDIEHILTFNNTNPSQHFSGREAGEEKKAGKILFLKLGYEEPSLFNEKIDIC